MAKMSTTPEQGRSINHASANAMTQKPRPLRAISNGSQLKNEYGKKQIPIEHNTAIKPKALKIVFDLSEARNLTRQ